MLPLRHKVAKAALDYVQGRCRLAEDQAAVAGEAQAVVALERLLRGSCDERSLATGSDRMRADRQGPCDCQRAC